MQSVRAIILRKYMENLKRLPEGAEKERVKGKIAHFLERCKKQDIKRRENAKRK